MCEWPWRAQENRQGAPKQARVANLPGAALGLGHHAGLLALQAQEAMGEGIPGQIGEEFLRGERDQTLPEGPQGAEGEKQGGAGEKSIGQLSAEATEGGEAAARGRASVYAHPNVRALEAGPLHVVGGNGVGDLYRRES